MLDLGPAAGALSEADALAGGTTEFDWGCGGGLGAWDFGKVKLNWLPGVDDSDAGGLMAPGSSLTAQVVTRGPLLLFCSQPASLQNVDEDF